jgi:hypothetical protein
MTALIVCASISVVFAAMWWLSARRAKLSGRLIQTSGTLEQIGFQRRKGGKGSPSYAITCRYDYLVGSEHRTGTRAALEFNNYPSEAAALKKIGTRKPGEAVTVWYDPADPKTAVLDNAPPAGTAIYKWLTILLWVVAAVGGVAAAITASSA